LIVYLSHNAGGLRVKKEEFNKALMALSSKEEVLIFARKQIIHGIPFVFNERQDHYFDFRNRISTEYKIGYYEVYVVGSAKLGFSFIKNTNFNMESDIDVAIVNENLFDYFLTKISEFQYQLDKARKPFYGDERDKYSKFLEYIAKGWMRPDLLPISFGIKELKDDWFNFFRSISYNATEVGNHKVNAGLYKNYSYLERYYVNNLVEIQNKLLIGEK
jgi:predicted nucleotidyltransferase